MDERDVRLARRFKIGVRLVFYPLALTLIVLAWQQRSHAKEPSPQTGWSGTTSQSRQIQAYTDHSGTLLRLDVHFVERCSNGATTGTGRWYAAQHRFVQHGQSIRGHQSWVGPPEQGWTGMTDLSIVGSVGDHPHGTIHATTRYVRGRETVSCESGPIAFTLNRD